MKKIFPAVFVVLCFGFNHAQAQNWDIDLLKKINPDNPSSDYWKGVSNSTYYVAIGIPVVETAIGYIEGNKNLKRNGWETIVTIAGSAIITEGIKLAANRTRPYNAYPDLIHAYSTRDYGYSMPSGHTSLAFATATSLALQYKKWYIVAPAYIWASSVGYSRLYLGEHYPSDVFVGAVIGAGSAVVTHWLAKKINPQKKTKPTSVVLK
ncbi:phosphatase PAP2 family protein [Chitinophagaceae bacterium LWZ2-11]